VTMCEHAARTDIGRARSHNEDACVAAPPVYAVADGVGGAASGELASSTALEVLQEHAGTIATLGDDDAARRAMADAIEACNARIHAIQAQNDTHAGMATTLTACIARPDGSVMIGHVGDSRAYRIEAAGSIEQLTDDHSMVGELVRAGQLTPEEAANHPQRNVITRALGPEPHISVDTSIVACRPGDVLLVCSDGLTTHVDDARISKIVCAAPSLEHAADELIQRANDRGGSDNISVVLVRPVSEAAGAVMASEAHLPAETTPVNASPAETSGEIAVVPIARPTLGTEPDHTPHNRKLRWAVTLLVLAIIAGITLWTWNNSYFITTRTDGTVIARQGFPLGGLHRAYRTSPVTTRDVSDADLQRYVAPSMLRSRSDVDLILARLLEDSGLCDRAAGVTKTTPTAPVAACQ
jgi:serine/threonine protein phosphatase PrpC